MTDRTTEGARAWTAEAPWEDGVYYFTAAHRAAPALVVVCGGRVYAADDAAGQPAAGLRGQWFGPVAPPPPERPGGGRG